MQRLLLYRIMFIFKWFRWIWVNNCNIYNGNIITKKCLLTSRCLHIWGHLIVLLGYNLQRLNFKICVHLIARFTTLMNLVSVLNQYLLLQIQIMTCLNIMFILMNWICIKLLIIPVNARKINKFVSKNVWGLI